MRQKQRLYRDFVGLPRGLVLAINSVATPVSFARQITRRAALAAIR